MPHEDVDVRARFIDNVSREVAGAQKKTDGSFAKMESSASKVTTAVKGLVGAYLGFRGLQIVLSFSAKATEAFQVQQDAEESLSASIRGTVSDMGMALDRFKEYASGIQEVTRFGDDAILSAIAYGKNLGIQTEQLQDAAKAAVGLAARFKLDLQSAMMLVGRASTGQTALLTRYGIVVDKTLSKQDQFNQLLEIGAESFGLAEEAARTHSGQLEQTQNSIGDLEEEIGERMIPIQLAWNKAKLRGIQLLTEFIAIDTRTDIQKVEDSIKSLKLEIDAAKKPAEGVLEVAQKLGEAEFFGEDVIEGITEGSAGLTILNKKLAESESKLAELKEREKELTELTLSGLDEPEEDVATKKARLAREKEFQKTRLAINLEFQELVMSDRAFALAREQEEYERRLEIIKGNQDAENELLTVHLTNQASIHKKFDDADADAKKKKEDAEKEEIQKTAKLRRDAVRDTISGSLQIAEMFKDNSRDMFAFTKALAIAQTTMNAYETVSAFLTAKPAGPWSIPQALLAGGLAFSQVAKIMGTEFQAAALGADFVTAGRRLLMVGDNPGGRERVQVTPLSSPNISGPRGELKIDASMHIAGGVTQEALPGLEAMRERQIEDMRELLIEMEFTGQGVTT